jgi:hypothetical protein
MHINNHAIALVSIHGSCNHNQCITRNKIPDASLTLFITLVVSLDVEFQCFCACEKKQYTAQRVQERLENCHRGAYSCGVVESRWDFLSRKGELLDVAFWHECLGGIIIFPGHE